MAARIPTAVQSGRQIIIVIDVARSAGHAGMPIGKWKPDGVVIEIRPRPTYRRCMAPVAIRNREKRWRRSMRRIRSLLPGGHMAP